MNVNDQGRPLHEPCGWGRDTRLITKTEAAELQALFDLPAAAGIEDEGEVYHDV